MSKRKADIEYRAGWNLNTPIRMYDTHPNRRFAVGEEVIPVDPADVPMTGQVLGHCAEDRVWVRWGHGLITQEDGDDLIAKREYSVTSSIVNEVSYDSSKQDDRSRQAGRQAAPGDVETLKSKGGEMMSKIYDSINSKPVESQTPAEQALLKNLNIAMEQYYQEQANSHTPGMTGEGGGDSGMLDSYGTDNFGSNGRNSSKGEQVITRSEAYVGLRGAASMAASAGFAAEGRVIEAARQVAEALETQFGNRPQRIAKSKVASQALVNASADLETAIGKLVASKKPLAVQAGLAAGKFFMASVAYDPLREDNHDDPDKIVEDAIKEGNAIVPAKTNTTKES